MDDSVICRRRSVSEISVREQSAMTITREIDSSTSLVARERLEAQTAVALWNRFDEDFGAFADEHSIL